jgi:DNA repair exonuclease SbcCD nuclease subunit
MRTSVIFIGDPHFQVSNIEEVEIFVTRITDLVTERKPTIVVIGGDLLHTHERLHTIALNKAYDFVDKMRKITKTYVLVGNHDYIQNQQFLTDNHWMNAMKDWKNTVIVDKVIVEVINNEKLVFTPYVPPGRFEEALNTIGDDWKDASCIFAHQEFHGCKMGAIISEEGDKWSIGNPYVVSGHIHSRQIPQENIYYSGSAMQHAFGESEKNIIACLEIQNRKYTLDEVDLSLPRKKIVYVDTETIDDFVIPTDTEDKIKVSVSGNYNEFKALKKSKKYKEMVKRGVKVVFKPKRLDTTISEENTMVNIEDERVEFMSILNSIIDKERDEYLKKIYSVIINGIK